MEPRTYTKRPIEVEALQWTGGNLADLLIWAKGSFDFIEPEDRVDDPDHTAQVYVAANGVWVGIETGEWIIRDSKGFYPCKADVFAETYEVPEAKTDAPEEPAERDYVYYAQERFFTAAQGQPPTEDQRRIVTRIGVNVVGLAAAIDEEIPAGRNKSLALTALEDVQMRANRALFAKGESA